MEPKREALIAEIQPGKHDIREIIYRFYNRKINQKILQKAHIGSSVFSRFINYRARLDCFAFTRLLLAMGFKIYDPNGNLVLGNAKQDINAQIKDNLLSAEEEQQKTENNPETQNQ